MSLVCFPTFCRKWERVVCRRSDFFPSCRYSLCPVLHHHLLAIQLDTTKYIAHPFGFNDASGLCFQSTFFPLHPCLAGTLFFLSSISKSYPSQRSRDRFPSRSPIKLIFLPWCALGAAADISTLCLPHPSYLSLHYILSYIPIFLVCLHDAS